MIEVDGRMKTDNLTSMPVRGEAVVETVGRLAYVASLVDRRLSALGDERDGSLLPPAWAHAPAFELHINSGLRELLGDDECRRALRHIVCNGVRTHVVVFVHGDLAEAASAFAGVSSRLAAELVEGRALRHAGCRS